MRLFHAYGRRQDPPPISELQRRFNSLRSNVLSDRYKQGVFVVERGEQNNRLHFHSLVVLDADIRTNEAGTGPVDFEAFKKGDYRTASRKLRSEWAFWRKTAPFYGFGRTELLPVKSTAEGIARYVGGYIKKHVGHRAASDKGKRMIRFLNYGAGDRKASSRLAWNSERSWLWRQKVGVWAKRFKLGSMDDIKDVCGPRWAYLFQQQILGQHLAADTVAPSERAAVEAIDQWVSYEARIGNAKFGERQQQFERTVLLTEDKFDDYEERPF